MIEERDRDTVLSGLDDLSLPAMLSAALVAFTIECDNEIEPRFADRIHGGMISLVAWLNAMQYLRDGPTSVADISARSHTSKSQVSFLIGKLEHWGWVSQETGPGAAATPARRGFGTARQTISAIRPSSTFTSTEKGEAAIELWPEVIDTVESRWQQRLESVLAAALKALSKVVRSSGRLMPEGVPPASANRVMSREWREFPKGRLEEPSATRVPVLFGRALLAAKIAYDERSTVTLALAANTLRVVDENGTPISSLYLRTGNPPETATSQSSVLKSLGLAEVVAGPKGRGKLLLLTQAGRNVQAAHEPAIREVEAAIDPDGKASTAMRALLGRSHDGGLAIRVALTPPPGVRRSGTPWAVGAGFPSAQARDREVVAQTEAFLADPFRTLPHYPIWEATRAFGP